MITHCPHCQTEIEIDGTTHAALAGQSHFACPACQGAVEVPAGAGSRPRLPRTSRKLASAPAAQLRSGHRNLLILGTVALLVLGGIGIYLASKGSGDSQNTTQNVRNEIINNTYFQNLTTSGVTTREELEQLGAILPYGEGFIGISAETSDWEKSNASAARLGAHIIDLANPDVSSDKDKLISWLNGKLSEHLQVPVWVRERGVAAILDGKQVLESTATERQRRYLVHWNPAAQSQGLASSVASGQGDVASANWDSFDPGPVVFEDTLTADDQFEKFYYFAGQYGNGFTVLPGMGIRSDGGHTWSMLWARAVLGQRCRVEFEVEIPEGSAVCWVMKGSGTGNNSGTSDEFSIHSDRVKLRKAGADWKIQPLPEKSGAERFVRIQTDYNGPDFRVWVDGKLTLEGTAETALDNPFTRWFGLSGYRCIYKNLKIRSSFANQNLEPKWSPDPSEEVKPRPNGREVYASSFSKTKSPTNGWWSNPPEAAFEENGALVIMGTTLAALEKPIPRNSAVEISFEYPGPEALNLRIPLIYASQPVNEMTSWRGAWALSLPHGHGASVLKWHNEAPGGPPGSAIMWAAISDVNVVESQQFYLPISGRRYLLRIEITDLEIRVFLDGGLLFHSKNPSSKSFEGQSLYLGLGQLHSQNLIHSVNVYETEDN